MRSGPPCLECTRRPHDASHARAAAAGVHTRAPRHLARTTSSALAGRSRAPSLPPPLPPASARRSVRANRASASAARNRLRCSAGQGRGGTMRDTRPPLACWLGHAVTTERHSAQRSDGRGGTQCAAAPARSGAGRCVHSRQCAHTCLYRAFQRQPQHCTVQRHQLGSQLLRIGAACGERGGGHGSTGSVGVAAGNRRQATRGVCDTTAS